MNESTPTDENSAAQASIDPQGRRWLRAAFACIAWCVTAVLLLAVALRIFWHDATIVLTQINAFTFYVYLPAYACGAWAAWRRRWRLATLNGLIVACHLAWVAPDFRPAQSFVPPSPDSVAPSPTVRIFYANVRADSSDYDAMLAEIAAADPDIILLNEFVGKWERAFRASPVIKPYLKNDRWAQYRFSTMGIYSRLPIDRPNAMWSANRQSCEIDVLLGSNNALRLFFLHGPRPLEMPFYDYYAYWDEVLPLLARQPEPLVVIGDFNATQHANVYQQITSTRLRSAHADRGRGYATTWPNGRYPLPPIRIDHALLSPQVECLRIAEGQGIGSDHRPLILDIRFQPER